MIRSGVRSRSSRSLKVAGSLSSALQTMYFSSPRASRTSRHFCAAGVPAPPMPRRLACSSSEIRLLRTASRSGSLRGGLELLGERRARPGRAATRRGRRPLPADRDRSARAAASDRPASGGTSRPSRWAATIVRSRAAKVADGRSLQDADLLGLPGSVQLDQHGRRAVAAAQAGDALDLDPRLAAELAGNGLEPCKATGRAAQVASDVAADVNLDIRRRLHAGSAGRS